MWNKEVYLVYFLAISMGWSPALGEENLLGANIREPRHSKNKLCYKYGICGGYGNQGYQGYQGNQGYQGYQGYQGNQGYYGGYNQGGYNPGGYHGGYQGNPPVNIAISQSQSLSNFGGGGFGSSPYPNNYNYNGGYNGYQGANRPGYFGSGFGSYNSQYNENYYGGGGRYGFQRPFRFGNDYSEEDSNEDYGRSAKSKDSSD